MLSPELVYLYGQIQFTLVTVDADGAAVLAADPERKVGAWLMNVGTVNDAICGETEGESRPTLVKYIAERPSSPIFIPGGHEIWAEALADTTQIAVWSV